MFERDPRFTILDPDFEYWFQDDVEVQDNIGWEGYDDEPEPPPYVSYEIKE